MEIIFVRFYAQIRERRGKPVRTRYFGRYKERENTNENMKKICRTRSVKSVCSLFASVEHRGKQRALIGNTVQFNGNRDRLLGRWMLMLFGIRF